MGTRTAAAASRAVASLLLLVAYCSPARSWPDETLMFFSGSDFWGHGSFLHGGALWAPGGLNNNGIIFKTVISGGRYNYFSGGLGLEVGGRETVAQFMPGVRFKIAEAEVRLYAGADLQWHQLSPDDPGSGLRGQQAGMRAGFEFWLEPTPDTMIAADGSISSLNGLYSARLAAGWRMLPDSIYRFYLGPEAQTFSGGNYEQYRFGLHVTSLKIDFTEWSFAVGWARDSDDRSSAYARVGTLTRY